MILRSKLRMTLKTAMCCLAGGLLSCSLLFSSAGCTDGAGDAAPSVDAARGTGDDDPVVDESADDADTADGSATE